MKDKKNTIVSKDLEQIQHINNFIQKSLNESKLKYLSKGYSPIFTNKDNTLYAIMIVTAGSKRNVIMDCLTDKEKQLLQVINLEEWTEL